MSAQVRSILVGFALILALAVTTPARAGGAWARGKGKFFASVTYSTFGDIAGYVQSLYARIPGVDPIELTEEIGNYAEIGLTDRLTFGLDQNKRVSDDTGTTIWFLRYNYSRPEWRSSYGVELGQGTYTGYPDWRLTEDTITRIGLSWGRSFESRWIDGWVDVDAKISGLESRGSVFWKVDTTFGIKPGDRSLIYLQMQSGALDGYPTYTRAVPTVVFKLWRGLSLESAALIGIQNDDTYGMKMGAWLEF